MLQTNYQRPCNTTTWSLLESDVNITSDTTYCIILALLRKTQCFSLSKLSAKIIILSFKTINNHASPLFPVCPFIYHIFHPNQPVTIPQMCLMHFHTRAFLRMFLYLEPLHLEEVFPALEYSQLTSPRNFLQSPSSQPRCHCLDFDPLHSFTSFPAWTVCLIAEIISRLWKYILIWELFERRTVTLIMVANTVCLWCIIGAQLTFISWKRMPYKVKKTDKELRQ